MKSALIGMLAVGFVGLAGPASASVMLPLSVPELTREADVVVRGRVVALESRPSASGRRIFTVVTLEVTDEWKGAPGSTVEIHVPGGTYDGLSQMVVGAPRFREGDDVVVFLRRPGKPPADGSRLQAPARGPMRVVGMAQGLLHVHGDPADGEVAEQELEGIELVSPETRESASPPLPEPVAVDRLEDQVRAVGP